MHTAITDEKLVTLRAFASEVGLSTVTLWKLFKKGQGPERIIVREENHATGRVLIPLERGKAWARARQEHIHPSRKAVAQAARDRAAAERKVRNEAIRASARVIGAL